MGSRRDAIAIGADDSEISRRHIALEMSAQSLRRRLENARDASSLRWSVEWRELPRPPPRDLPGSPYRGALDTPQRLRAIVRVEDDATGERSELEMTIVDDHERVQVDAAVRRLASAPAVSRPPARSALARVFNGVVLILAAVGVAGLCAPAVLMILDGLYVELLAIASVLVIVLVSGWAERALLQVSPRARGRSRLALERLLRDLSPPPRRKIWVKRAPDPQLSRQDRELLARIQQENEDAGGTVCSYARGEELLTRFVYENK